MHPTLDAFHVCRFSINMTSLARLVAFNRDRWKGTETSEAVAWILVEDMATIQTRTVHSHCQLEASLMNYYAHPCASALLSVLLGNMQHDMIDWHLLMRPFLAAIPLLIPNQCNLVLLLVCSKHTAEFISQAQPAPRPPPLRYLMRHRRDRRERQSSAPYCQGQPHR